MASNPDVISDGYLVGLRLPPFIVDFVQIFIKELTSPRTLVPAPISRRWLHNQVRQAGEGAVFQNADRASSDIQAAALAEVNIAIDDELPANTKERSIRRVKQRDVSLANHKPPVDLDVT